MERRRNSPNSVLLILITYTAFISLGLPDGLLGIAWPFMSEKFHVPLDALGILLIGFVSGYLFTSTTSGKILTIIPLGLLLTLSCFLTGFSLLIYAFSNVWYTVIFASFFLGSGGGAIDTSINVFAASRFSPSVVNWLHGFYGIGATLGPVIMTWMLTHGNQWYHGYVTVGIVQILLSLVFLLSLKYWKVASEEEVSAASPTYAEVLSKPLVWINVLIFFLYTGLEIGVGQWIFTLLTHSRNVDQKSAGLWTSIYWGSFTAGRMIFGFILTKARVHKVVTYALSGIIVGTALLVINHSDQLNLLSIIVIGFSNAPVFPSLISITPERLGEKYLNIAVGFQISSAMVGGALLPGFAGLMSDPFGLEIIPMLFLIEAVILWGVYLFAYGKKL